jgi:tetratricopeptide (TPR) repeat protein
VRLSVSAKAKKWDLALEIAQTLALELPHEAFGHVQAAYMLDRLNRTPDAAALLQSVVGNFPEDAGLRYDLACYSCKLGDLKHAMEFLERAIDLAGKNDIRQKALDDPALEQLWTNISEI